MQHYIVPCCVPGTLYVFLWLLTRKEESTAVKHTLFEVVGCIVFSNMTVHLTSSYNKPGSLRGGQPTSATPNQRLIREKNNQPSLATTDQVSYRLTSLAQLLQTRLLQTHQRSSTTSYKVVTGTDWPAYSLAILDKVVTDWPAKLSYNRPK
jgi:hypothetical protein